MMRAKKMTAGDLLYHPVHGLCRIRETSHREDSGGKTLVYSLVPKITSRMKVQFVIQASDIDASGFHSLMSAREAGEILDYLKAGDSSEEQTRQAWVLARAILSFSTEKFAARDQRKRQQLEYSAKGLVGELAFVLRVEPREAAEMIQKSLGEGGPNHAPVSLALSRACED